MKNKKLGVLLIAVNMGLHAGGYLAPAYSPVEPATNMFIYGAIGASMLDVQANPEDSPVYIDGALDDQGYMGEIGLGYKFSENIFATLAYQRSMIEMADIDTLFTSINYQFSNSGLQPYVGLIAGYSTLTWCKAPSAVHLNQKLDSKSMAYGVQVGVSKKLGDNVSVFGKYQYVSHDHKMDIYTPGHQTIEHKNAQNIMVGVQYGF